MDLVRRGALLAFSAYFLLLIFFPRGEMKVAVVEVACPRCGTRLEYWIEKEPGNSMRRITYYYRCPRCLYRLNDTTIVVKRNNNGNGLVIELH